MADEFSKVALGEAVLNVSQMTVKAESAITKGDIVQWKTHTDDELASVEPAGNESLIVAGIALKDISAGEWGPMLNIGIVKALSGGSTLGKHQMAVTPVGTDGIGFKDSDAYGKVCARAVQTIGSGNTGLFFINV